MYPSLAVVAPKMRAISFATLGFSAIQTIILYRFRLAKIRIIVENSKEKPFERSFLTTYYKEKGD